MVWDVCARVQPSLHHAALQGTGIPPSPAPHPLLQPAFGLLGAWEPRGELPRVTPLLPEWRRDKPRACVRNHAAVQRDAEQPLQPRPALASSVGWRRERTWSSCPGCRCPPLPLLCSLLNQDNSSGAPQPPCHLRAFLLLLLPTSCGQGMRAQLGVGTRVLALAAPRPHRQAVALGTAGVERGQALRNVVFSIPVSVKVVNQHCKRLLFSPARCRLLCLPAPASPAGARMRPSLPTLPGLTPGTGFILAKQGWGPVMPRDAIPSHPSFLVPLPWALDPCREPLAPHGGGFPPSIPHSLATSFPLLSPPCWKRSCSPTERCQGGTG